jgi:hypothetical protein
MASKDEHMDGVVVDNQQATTPIVYEPRLSRYVTCNQLKHSTISSETKSYCPPLYEEVGDFKRRVKGYYLHATSLNDYVCQGKVIWFITHNCVLREISSIIGVCPPECMTVETYIAIKGEMYNKKGSYIEIDAEDICDLPDTVPEPCHCHERKRKCSTTHKSDNWVYHPSWNSFWNDIL